MPRNLFTTYTQLRHGSAHYYAAFLLLLVARDSLLADHRNIFAGLSCIYVLAFLINNHRTRTGGRRRRRRRPPPLQLASHSLTDIDSNRPLSDTARNDHVISDLPSPIRIPTPTPSKSSPPLSSTWDSPPPSLERFPNRPLYLGNPSDSAEHRMYRDRERRFYEYFAPRPPPPTHDGERVHGAARNRLPYRHPQYQAPYADTVEDEDAFGWQAEEVETARGRKGRGDLWGKGR